MESRVFWHNLGIRQNGRWWKYIVGEGSVPTDYVQRWWSYLLSSGQISAGFYGKPGDRGERLLTTYRHKDIVVVYASGYGAIAWGSVSEPVYRLVDRDHDEFSKSGFHLHRLTGITWQGYFENLHNALSPRVLKEKFGLKFPRQTREAIRTPGYHPVFEKLTDGFPAH